MDFLGFEIRRFWGKLLTKPSKDALRRIRKRLSQEVTALRGANADAMIAKLNPIIKGWAAYYRIGVSKRAFGALDAHLWRLVYKSPRSPTRTSRSGGSSPGTSACSTPPGVTSGRSGARRLASTCASSPGRRLSGTGWSQDGASPDDPALIDYWTEPGRRARAPSGRPHVAASTPAGRPMSALPGPAAARRP
ncbi:group II intron maturase-specific domain-containing protein [Nonomuraea polychroma]|uniref:group II intron maturase-specific domain-containing protein n=1 Tax=Nonomuraea polychroma TaxID=46176 RepID=UPI003D8B8705